MFLIGISDFVAFFEIELGERIWRDGFGNVIIFGFIKDIKESGFGFIIFCIFGIFLREYKMRKWE